jgi:F-type H+-transporting ATPase subunit epsilon
MADMMQFDLVSPERRLASFKASSVSIPGASGDLTAMAGHEPLITTLRPGVLSVATADGEQSYVVTGGFAEITAGATTVLAEKAMPVNEATASMLDELMEDAAKAAVNTTGDIKDAADKLNADLLALRAAVGV